MSFKKKIFIAFAFVGVFVGAVIITLSSYVVAGDNYKGKVTSVKMPPPIDVPMPYGDGKPQELAKADIAIKTKAGKIHKYRVEIAVTGEQIRIGMMFRKYIEENTGMLFAFKGEAERNFWMKNTLIPLDLLFIKSDGTISHIHHMAEEESLKPISSNGKVSAVLEIAGGEAEILGINVGDHVLYKDF